MPIEFACTACAKVVRVPDGCEGKKCKCPACKATLEVPDALEVIAEVIDEPIEDIQIKLEVPCPRCKFVLICNPDLEGTRGLCPNCKFIFTITPPVSTKQDGTNAATDGAENLQLTYAFQCPHCDQLFEGKPGMEGRNGKCTHCQRVFQIKRYIAPALMAVPIKSKSLDRFNNIQSAKSDPSRQITDGTIRVEPLFATPVTKKDWLTAIPSPYSSADPVSEPYAPYVAKPSEPQTGRSSRLAVSGDAASIRANYLAQESALKGFGILFAVNSVVEVLAACGSLLVGVMILVSPSEDVGPPVGLILVCASVVYLLLAAVTGFVAAGLLKLNAVGRIGMIIFAVLGLCAIPLGTIISAYMLYLVLSEKGAFVFSEEYSQVVRDTPHMRASIPIFVWVLFAFFALCLFGGILLIFVGR